MIQKNLILLEYMVKKRIEEDRKRLEAIKGVNELMSKADVEIENFSLKNQASILKKLVAVKGTLLTYREYELIEEIFKINK